MIAISTPVIIVALINYFAYKKKVVAETKKIELQNKITKEITYDQLKSDNKHKEIKSKIEIFQGLVKLEEEIKNKENKTASDQKKLESLEMIKKEFKETFAAETKKDTHLIEKEKILETKKETDKATRKTKATKTGLKGKK